MRTSMKIRRGLRGAVDPITAQYDAILATEPDIPLLFRLIEYRGQIVLFQDAPCTIPVEDIGDPVGGQRHPVTGEVLAVQTTDGARPIWGGEGVGLVFDGESSHLLSVDDAGFLPETADFYVVADPEFNNFIDQSQILSQNESSVTGRMQALRIRTSPFRFSMFWSEVDTTPLEISFPSNPEEGDWYMSLSREMNEGSTGYTMRTDLFDEHGQSVGNGLISEDEDHVILQTNSGIGFRTNGDDRYFDGNIKALIFGEDPDSRFDIVQILSGNS